VHAADSLAAAGTGRLPNRSSNGLLCRNLLADRLARQTFRAAAKTFRSLMRRKNQRCSEASSLPRAGMDERRAPKQSLYAARGGTAGKLKKNRLVFAAKSERKKKIPKESTKNPPRRSRRPRENVGRARRSAKKLKDTEWPRSRERVGGGGLVPAQAGSPRRNGALSMLDQPTGARPGSLASRHPRSRRREISCEDSRRWARRRVRSY